MKGTNLDLPEGESLIPPEVEDTMQETAKQQQELLNLQSQLSKKLLWMVGTVSAMAIALFFLVRAFYTSDVWTKLGWLISSIALSAIALATIAIFMWAGDDSIVNLIKRMGDNEKFGLVNQGINVGDKLTQVGLTAAALTTMLGMCWIPWSTISNMTSTLGKILTKFLGSIVTIAGGQVLNQVKTEASTLYNNNKQNKG